MPNQNRESSILRISKKEDLAASYRKRLVSLMKLEKPSFLKNCEFRPVRTIEEFKMCSHLVYLEYRRKGYATPNAGSLRITPFHFLKQATTFIALYKSLILGTLTLIEDSPLGVPMDTLYKPEIDCLRRGGKHLAEVSMLAMNDEILNQPSIPNAVRLYILLHLIKSLKSYTRQNTDIDTYVACFHPKHELFYRAIRFEPLGDLKSYSSVKGSPAIAFVLDLNYSGDKDVMAMKEFFGLAAQKGARPSTEKYLQFSLRELGEMFINSKTELRNTEPPGKIKKENSYQIFNEESPYYGTPNFNNNRFC